MTEPPPAKRAKRDSSAVMWDKQHHNQGTALPKSPRPHETSVNGNAYKHESEHYNGARRSRSPTGHDRDRNRDRDRFERGSRRERSRSRDRRPQHDRDRGGGGRDRRDQERSRSRDRDRDRHRKQQRSRSRSPPRNGAPTAARKRSPPGRSSDHDRISSARTKNEQRDSPVVRSTKQEFRRDGDRSNGIGHVAKQDNNNDMDMDLDDNEDAALKRIMGFSTFKTTQNTKVPGNQIYGVRKEKKTEYRQYMNRMGGFNRPLSPGR